VAAAVPFAVRASEDLTAGGFDIRGSQSQQVERTLQDVPVDYRGVVLAVALVADGPARRADYAAALDDVSAAARATPGVDFVREAKEVGLYLARERPGRAVVVPLTVAVDEFHAPDAARDLRVRLGLDDGARYGNVRLHLVGQGALWAGMLDVTQDDLREAELLGFPLVLLILLAVFGSVAAAALPLVLGAATLTLTAALIHLLSTATLMSFYSTNMASMIGLGVAVDYALFVVVRYREELRRGATREGARATAMRTSGGAVLVSGAAVIVALAALLLIESAAVRSLALGSIVVVAIALLATATLLPRLLLLVGPGREPGTRAIGRWADAVLRRPGRALAAALVLLAALSLPALGLKTGDGALRQFPDGNETLAGFEAAVRETGPGRGAPVKLLVARRDVDATVALLRADPEVVKTGVRTQTKDKRRILVVATPRHDGDSPEAKALVRRLRAALPAGTLVGGNTAAQVDFNAAVRTGLPRVLAWIVALTFLLLLVSLRSLPLALGGVLTNLLSVAAAFGVLTVTNVWTGPGYVDTITIPLVLAVVFGLSMDYEIFLLSRMRERFLARGDARDAIRAGLTGSARTITGAALIMVAVFAAFVVTGVPVVQQVGLGAAAAIAVDATIVRMLLVPAAMALLGDRAWWVPTSKRPAARSARNAVRAWRPGR